MEVILTHHAGLRAREMGVTYAEVAEVILDAEVDYGGDRRVAQRGVLAVAYVRDGGRVHVLTVLRREVEQWTR